MRLLVRSELRTQYVNIENNFLYAALHIYAFNMGIFPEGVIPNLPGEQKNVQMFVVSLTGAVLQYWYPPSQFADEVSQQEYNEVTVTLLKHHNLGPGGNTGHASLCAPLHLALFISPIYLLFPFRIVKQSFHRWSIIEVSHKLGPHKPPVLVKLENLIWDAIFAIAERPLHIKDIIIELASHICGKEEEYASCSPMERSWFTLSNGKLFLAVLTQHQLTCAQISPVRFSIRTTTTLRQTMHPLKMQYPMQYLHYHLP